MSFLDDQATGQIGIGEKASLSTLTRRKRKRKRGQAPTGAETYSLLPQDEFSNLVSSPTDIQRVGIGNLLQAQGTAAGDVPNVFDEYVSAAPRGTTLEAIYYQPPPDDDDDPGDDDDLPSVEDDPYIPSFDTGVDEPDNPNNPDNYAANPSKGEGVLADLKGFVEGIINIPQAIANKVALATAKPELSEGFFTGIDVAPPTEGNVVDAETAEYEVGQFQAMNPDADAGSGEGPGGDGDAPSTSVDVGDGVSVDWSVGSMLASGGTVKSKNKKSFMSMKGK